MVSKSDSQILAARQVIMEERDAIERELEKAMPLIREVDKHIDLIKTEDLENLASVDPQPDVS
jgi:CO dehydrogenase/acetyl-CoA synthase beta subunit